MKTLYHIVVWRPKGSKTWTPVNDRVFNHHGSAFMHAAELSKQPWSQAHPTYLGKRDGVIREYNVATVGLQDPYATCRSRETMTNEQE